MTARALLVIFAASLGSSGCLMAARATYRSIHPPPSPPLVEALDANHDGVIDATELANATAALRTLDRNHDGQLSRNEYEAKR